MQALLPIEVSSSLQLVGLRGHGKSSFLESLLGFLYHHLPRQADNALLDLSAATVTESSRKFVEEQLANFNSAKPQLPTPGREPPLVLVIGNLPGCDNQTLAVLDYSGEYFAHEAAIDGRLNSKFFQTQNPLYIMIVSPFDLLNPTNRAAQLPEQALERIIQTLAENGENSKDKSLLVVLTKADKLLTQQMLLPAEAKTALQSKTTELNYPQLLKLSQKLSEWCKTGPASRVLGNFTSTAATRFKNVEFTIVSSKGADFNEAAQPVVAQPANMLGMLYLLNLMLRPVTKLSLLDTDSYFCSLTKALTTGLAKFPRHNNHRETQFVDLRLNAGMHPLLRETPEALSGTLLIHGSGVTQTIIELHESEPLQIQGCVTFRDLTIRFKSAAAIRIAQHSTLNLENCQLQLLEQSSNLPVRIESFGTLNLLNVRQSTANPVAVISHTGHVKANSCSLSGHATAAVLHLTKNATANLIATSLIAPGCARTTTVQLGSHHDTTIKDLFFSRD
ncbi:MAG: hypothetical protein ACKO3T_14145, partial [Planctomycetaceae bacterium]